VYGPWSIPLFLFYPPSPLVRDLEEFFVEYLKQEGEAQLPIMPE